MKQLFTFILITFSIQLAFSQNNYYWSNKRKISLTADSTNWTLIPRKGFSKSLASSTIKSQSRIINNVITSEGSNLINFSLNDYSPKAIKELKAKFSSHGDITCKHLVGSKTPITLTGDILLQPKKSISIQQITNLVKSLAKLIHSTEYNTFVLKANNIEETMKIANQIYESGLVDWCHPDFWVEIKKNSNDPLYGQQYYLNQSNNIDINAPEAWNITKGCSNIRVAVIDEGVEDHEDLSGRVVQGFTSRNATGYGAFTNPLPPTDLQNMGHGECVAGIIAATQDNGIGIAGIAPNSKIVPINIFYDWSIKYDGNGNKYISFNETPSDIAASINWAYDPSKGNADILNNSWDFSNSSGPSVDADAIRQAITNARTYGRGGKGSIVVFASGNNNASFSGVSFPANVNGVIAVGAIDKNGNIQGYSSRGPEMSLVTPSGGIPGDLVTIDRMGANGYDPGNYTSTFNGTSAACPQVSGVAALMLSLNPNLTETQVRTILQQSATDMGPAGFDNTYGYGRLNAYAALQAVQNFLTISGPSLICTTSQYSIPNLPSGATVTWSSSNTSGLTINSGGLATRVGSFNGAITLTASLNTCSAIPITKNIYIGTPQKPTVNFNSDVIISPGQGVVIIAYSTGGDPNQYSWRFSKVSGNYNNGIDIGSNNNSTTCTVEGLNAGSYKVFVKALNSCGIYSPEEYVYIKVKQNGGGALVVYPNPAAEQLTVAMIDSSWSNPISLSAQSTYQETSQNAIIESADFKVDVYNQFNKLLKSGKSINGKMELNTSDLLNGFYYLHIQEKDRLTRKQVLIQH